MTPRRLADLYVVGKEVVFDDGAGDPVKIWLQKISPLDHETALRRANLTRSRILARNEASAVEADTALFEAEQMGHESRVEYLIVDAVQKKMPAFEAEAAAEEPWSKDGYLQGLRDAWADGLEARYLEDPEDEEALHVFNEMKKFSDIVQERIEEEKESVRADLETRDEKWVLNEVADRFLQSRADLSWLTEFRKAEVWLAARDPKNHRKRYFDDRSDVDELAQEVLIKLLEEYRDLIVEPVEGKDSAAQDTSLPSSESPDKQETDAPSGLTAVSN